jgi:hypothetical protein
MFLFCPALGSVATRSKISLVSMSSSAADSQLPVPGELWRNRVRLGTLPLHTRSHTLYKVGAENAEKGLTIFHYFFLGLLNDDSPVSMTPQSLIRSQRCGARILTLLYVWHCKSLPQQCHQQFQVLLTFLFSFDLFPLALYSLDSAMSMSRNLLCQCQFLVDFKVYWRNRFKFAAVRKKII